jgi:hypothetical protein
MNNGKILFEYLKFTNSIEFYENLEEVDKLNYILLINKTIDYKFFSIKLELKEMLKIIDNKITKLIKRL